MRKTPPGLLVRWYELRPTNRTSPGLGATLLLNPRRSDSNEGSWRERCRYEVDINRNEAGFVLPVAMLTHVTWNHTWPFGQRPSGLTPLLATQLTIPLSTSLDSRALEPGAL